jgi:hypothetical protein
MDLHDETQYLVEIDSLGVTCIDPTGNPAHIAWDAADEVLFETNDRGPSEIDVWLVLRGARETCRVPSGAPGQRELLHESCKARFEGIDWKAATAAASSVDNREFILWRRSQPSP